MDRLSVVLDEVLDELGVAEVDGAGVVLVEFDNLVILFQPQEQHSTPSLCNCKNTKLPLRNSYPYCAIYFTFYRPTTKHLTLNT